MLQAYSITNVSDDRITPARQALRQMKFMKHSGMEWNGRLQRFHTTQLLRQLSPRIGPFSAAQAAPKRPQRPFGRLVELAVARQDREHSELQDERAGLESRRIEPRAPPRRRAFRSPKRCQAVLPSAPASNLGSKTKTLT